MGRVPDANLSVLNDGERTALVLLAQGHTAKSIAHLTGRSVTSVNERLREARRKTGIGSSRELARLLAAQENRDKQIGVAERPASAPIRDPEAAAPAAGSLIKGLLVMIPIALTAAAAFVLLAPGTPKVVQDAAFPGGATPADAHARLAAEPRDPVWAPQAETALRAQYETVPEIAANLKVRCGTTLCEITARFALAPGADQNSVWQRLQAPPVTEDITPLRLKNSMTGFSDGTLPFYAFWVRADPAAIAPRRHPRP